MIKILFEEGEGTSVLVVEEPPALDEQDDGAAATSFLEESEGDTDGDTDADSDVSSERGISSSEPMESTSVLARPFLDTPLDDFTVTEGFLLLIFVMLCVVCVVGLTRGGRRL